MSVKILAIADLHLGRTASVPNISNPPSAAETLDEIVRFAMDNAVDVLTLSGDIVDNYNRYWEAVSPLQNAITQLQQAGIYVIMVAGNHDFDVLNEVIKNSRSKMLFLLGKNAKWESIQLNINGQDIQFVGWSFNSRYTIHDPLRDFDPQQISKNIPTVGLLHCEADTPESQYAPVNSDTLSGSGVDVWILGHIHKASQLKKSNPLIFYPGSPLAMNAGEQGIHGASLVIIDDSGQINYESYPFSAVRYENIKISIKPELNQDEFRSLVLNVLEETSPKLIDDSNNLQFLIYDLQLSGEHDNPVEIANWAQELTDIRHRIPEYPNTQILIRKYEISVNPALTALENLAKESSPAGKLADSIICLQNGDENPFINKLRQSWHEKQNALSKHNTFRELNHFDTTKADEADRYILQECRYLLTELLAQQENE
ncbi:MAG: DNA repair exonuclease [Bacteroidales bacterium]|nr:DNA repair exonuclease [Bacteroidales bacterium]